MSRYSENLEVDFGWDPGLETYYIQVNPNHEPEPVHWVGTSFREIPTLDALKEALNIIPVASILLGGGMPEELESDRLNNE